MYVVNGDCHFHTKFSLVRCLTYYSLWSGVEKLWSLLPRTHANDDSASVCPQHQGSDSSMSVTKKTMYM